MKLTTLMILVLLALAGAARADCTYNGVNYPEGTWIGPYVCTAGTWVKR